MTYKDRLDLEDDQSSVGNCAEIYMTGDKPPRLSVRIENPWAGDTETGFGRTCNIELDLDRARQLRDWLTKTLGA